MDCVDAGIYCPAGAFSPWSFCHDQDVNIGRSATMQITTIIPIQKAALVRFECPTSVDNSNWLNYEKAGDTFDVMTSNENWTITTKRKDAQSGWSLGLQISCTVYASSIIMCPVCMDCYGLTDFNIRTAAQLWVSNRESATSKYGLVHTWDISQVTTLDNLWCGYDSSAGDLPYMAMRSFNGDISMWDVSKITTMEWAFLKAEAFNGDISKWDVSKVTSMKETFCDAYAFNADISKWDVSKVVDMYASESIFTLGNDLMCRENAILIRGFTDVRMVAKWR